MNISIKIALLLVAFAVCVYFGEAAKIKRDADDDKEDSSDDGDSKDSKDDSKEDKTLLQKIPLVGGTMQKTLDSVENTVSGILDKMRE